MHGTYPFVYLHPSQGLEGIHEEERGGGLGKARGGRRSAEGGPRDQINGAVLDLRPSTVSAQVREARQALKYCVNVLVHKLASVIREAREPE